VSLDRRLRSELDRDAGRIVTDLERNLGAVEARARRRSSIGSSALLATAAVIVLAIVVRLGSSVPSGGASPSPTMATPSPTTMAASPSPSFAAIAGTYTVSLDASNAAVAANHLAGSWTMRLVVDGEIFLSPPASFGSGTSSLSGLAFTLAADRFRSNIFYNDFCSSIGTYTWSLSGGHLVFASVDDTCAIRRALLSTAPWQIGP
jgi:hypothetical protein